MKFILEHVGNTL